jgi:type IV secretion system protein VirD4
MAKNRIRGKPKRRSNRVRDSDILRKMSKDIDNLADKGIRYLKSNRTKLIPYIIFALVGNKLSFLYRTSDAQNMLGKMSDTISSLGKILGFPVLSLNRSDIIAGIVTALMIRLLLYIKMQDAKNYRKGEEYGSASFGSAKDIEPFIDWDNPYNNLLLSDTERLSMNPRMKDPTTNRNKNVLIVGGSGSGKTRGHVKPNLMQTFGSYIVTDPKGGVVYETGNLLRKAGYKIAVLNTIDFKKSMHFNPFAYIRSETDIMKVVDAFVSGTTTGKQQGEQFWVDAEKLLYNALIGYIMEEGLDEEKNFSTMLDMINNMEIREDDDNFKNAVDFMFEDLEAKDPECYAVLQYKKFKQAAGKTAKSIMISVGARLARFDIPEVREIMSFDEMELDKLGDRKSALFIIISDTTKTMNFMATIMYTQVFNLLCEKADNEYGGSLPVPVHCILDEFSNLGKIPDFEILISTIRSRKISASVILQSLAQLNNTYDKAADIISDNCDTFLFLGGKGKTLKDISDLLGKETIDLYNTSDTRGTNRSFGLNYSKVGRELLTQDELAKMPGGKCIVQVRGVKPFYSDKYDITKHKRYKYLSDYDDRNIFDLNAYITGKATINDEDTCVMYM